MGLKYSTDAARELVLAGGAIHVYPAATVELKDGLSNGAHVTMDLAYDENLGRVVVTELRVLRPGVGSEIHTSLLHEIHITRALEVVVLNNMMRVVSPASGRLVPAIDVLNAFEPAKGRGRASVQRDAATIYTIATIANRPPLKVVSEQLQVSHSTAARRVAEARALGLLDATEPLQPMALPTDELSERLSKPRRVASNDG